MKNILSIQEIGQLVQELKQGNKNIVLVGGCFDLFHLGHITLLEEAKKQADVLVVFLESDKRIQQLKGSQRPLHTQQQRAHMLAALRPVDYVILLPNNMTNQDYDTVVKQLQPAIIATTQGSDATVHIQRQAEMIHATVHFVQPIQNLSTTRILDVVAKEL